VYLQIYVCQEKVTLIIGYVITGVICGYRVEDIEDKLMQNIRYLDKLIDELAKGRAMEKALRI